MKLPSNERGLLQLCRLQGSAPGALSVLVPVQVATPQLSARRWAAACCTLAGGCLLLGLGLTKCSPSLEAGVSRRGEPAPCWRRVAGNSCSSCPPSSGQSGSWL